MVVYTAMGEILIETTYSGEKGPIRINTINLSPGIYFVKAYSEEGVFCGRFAKGQ